MEVIYDRQSKYLSFKTEEGKEEAIVVLPEDDYAKLKDAFQELTNELNREKSKVLLLSNENITARVILETNEKMREELSNTQKELTDENKKMREELSNTQKELTDEKVNSGEYRGQIKGLKERVDVLEKQLAEERIKVEACMYLMGNLSQLRRSNYILGYTDAELGYGTSEDFQEICEIMIKYAKQYDESYIKAVKSLVSLSEDVCLIEKK